MYDLSVIIPARNEMFLARTVEDILQNKRGKTEIIVGLDGAWADPVIKDHPDVTILHSGIDLGQRAITNQCVRLSKARYIMKADAHCAFDEGFDVKMMDAFKEVGNNVTMIPSMKNLHAFDWKCMKCGKKWYQGPTPKECPNCDNKTDFKRKMVWQPRRGTTSSFFRFDKDMHFQYWRELGHRPESQGELAETMSIQGSCFMLTRDKYWELDICSEQFNSWGQQGVEVACKTWLSGGRVLVNKRTWYAHMFRTQGGDFSFPYKNPEDKIQANRDLSKQLFRDNKWDKATRDFQWLLDKFAPIPDWGGA